MSPALCFRIFEHLKELGLIDSSSIILDPLAGIGTTGLVAASLGLKSILAELEPKFIDLIKLNIKHLEGTLGHPIDITCIQGDSRHLSELLEERGLKAVMSPPYKEGEYQSRTRGDKGNKLREFSDNKYGKGHSSNRYFKGELLNYDNPANIGNLPDRPFTAITSPPYGNATKNLDDIEKWNPEKTKRIKEIQSLSTSMMRPYSDNPANIGNLKCVTSPPYEDSVNSDIVSGIDHSKSRTRHADGTIRDRSKEPAFQHLPGLGIPYKYGDSTGQIGKEKAESYQEAMLVCYKEIIKIANVLVVVVKDPTRKGKLYPLGDITQALMESAGWKILCRHRSMLFQEEVKQDLFGNAHKIVKGRLSFFKRLLYQKGSPVAQWESVIFATREGDEGLKAVMSPPYGEGVVNRDNRTSRKMFEEKSIPDTYGQTPGQIGNLKCIMSPPYQDSDNRGSSFNNRAYPILKRQKWDNWANGYGQTPGQIGNLR